MKNSKQKNQVLVKITNHDLFDLRVNDIDTTGLIRKGKDYKGNSRGFEGDLSIELHKDGFYKTITGEYGSENYKNEWGFILI